MSLLTGPVVAHLIPCCKRFMSLLTGPVVAHLTPCSKRFMVAHLTSCCKRFLVAHLTHAVNVLYRYAHELPTCSDRLGKAACEKSLCIVKERSALPSQIVMVRGRTKHSDIFEISDRLVST